MTGPAREMASGGTPSTPSTSATTPSSAHAPAATGVRLALTLIVLILLLAYGFSFLQVGNYESAITRQTFTISGAIPVPVIHLRPAERRGDAIAIIVHGYSGSKELMIGFGLELARMGVPSYLLDLPGHGESPVPLAATARGDRSPQLEQALDEVAAYARAHSDVPQPKIILLGHSLGTLVVGEYAMHQPKGAIAATILVSPILQDRPTLATPANLLVIVGTADISSIVANAPAIVAAGCGVEQYDCGDIQQGTARRLWVVPGANHITILTDATAFRATNAWVASVDALPLVPVESDMCLRWTVLGIACAFFALFPLISLLAHALARHRTSTPALQPASYITPAERAKALSLRVSMAIVALGVVLTVLVLRAWAAAADALQLAWLRTPLSWAGISLADYSASFALVLALIVAAVLYALHRRVPLPAHTDAWRQLALGIIVFLVLYVTVGTLATYAWERFLLDPARLVRAIPLTLAAAPLFLLIEGLVAAAGRGRLWRAALIRLGAYLMICVGISLAVALDPVLGFLSLLVPIQALLFVAVAALAWQIDRQRGRFALSTAVIATFVLGWAISAVFPIVG